ncbi:MAG: hypothetical protein JRG91_00890 [Deltaproteobacteria bacterium]|nr:hypothetical protein [Deltaproteobacteria bacterium]
MVLVSLRWAAERIVDFLRYVAVREDIDSVDAGSAPASPGERRQVSSWLLAREELGEERAGPHRGGSFLGWLIAREALEGEDGPSGGGEKASDEEAPDG